MIPEKNQNHILETMLRIRAFETKALHLFEQNKLRGSCHLCVGQEAIAATTCELLDDKDYITCSHRGHGYCIAKGGELKPAMAELMGKETGYCKGRGGSMHIVNMAKGHLGANAIVGGGIPIAVGGALACKILKNGHVAVAFFGDGASNQGTFHEALNLASVWKLPVIFVCENNGFGISVPVCQSTSVKDIGIRASGYDMPGVTIDGNDPEAIYAAFSEALQRAKAGDGPTLIECKTYRWYGHWIGDPELTRDKVQTKKWKDEKCPINRLKTRMIKAGTLTDIRFADMEKKAQAEADEAAEFSLNSPEPDPATVMDDVFTDQIPAII